MELLITILIISILAGLILGVAALAGETAREAQTRHTVARLHNLLMEHYNTYKTRRVRLSDHVETQIRNANLSPERRGQALAEARLYALREMMLMDIPDRWSDVVLAQAGNSPQAPLYLRERTDLSNVYLRRYQSLLSRTNSITGNTNTVADIRENENAECLYLFITLATGDGEARGLFGESSIGDTDGDGAPEFLDGWGRPIQFLRWAPGFDSQIQLNANLLGTPPANPNDTSNPWLQQANRDHDPFDMFRVEAGAFRLVPLIYSAGRDEEFGIYAADSAPANIPWKPPGNNVTVSTTGPPYLRPFLTPYIRHDNQFFGTAFDGTATDNVHNHLMGQR